MRFIYLIGISTLIILCGCDPESMLQKFTPPEDEALATNYVALLQQNKFEQIEKDLDPSLKGVQDTLVKMAKMIPSQDAVSIKIIGAQQVRNPDSYQINLSFEYQFPSKWMMINVAMQRKDGISTIIGFNVYPLADSLENLNKFTLAGKSFFQYVTLAFAVLIPFFTLYALVLCIRTKMRKRKWLWIIFILFGLGEFTVNWTTGQWRFAPLSFQLFGASAFAPMYGAWLITISLPVGAAVFLIRRTKLAVSTDAALN
jgi:hypothetical protein